MATKARKSDVDKAVEALEKAVSEQNLAGGVIERGGDKIIIPEHMTLESVLKTVKMAKDKAEESARTMAEFKANPNEALYAFDCVMKETFGALIGAQSRWLFWTEPGQSLAVPIAYGKTVNIAVGSAETPGLPLTFDVSPNFDDDDELGGSLMVTFNYQRKYEPLVQRIIDDTNRRLRENPLFKGQAIDAEFEFLNLGGFRPERVVYSAHERLQLEANILTPIRHTELWRNAGRPVKRGILLYGAYGTGKTLTALLTAYEAIAHGWTFVNVLPGQDITRALRIARRYQPAVVFYEDIDTETGGQRDERVNAILNEVDGMLGKDAEVMVIMTTNNVDRISKAMLRPGRLDSIIKVGDLDPVSASELIRAVAMDNVGGSRLVGDLDPDIVWAAAHDFPPAFVAEAVTKAVSYALTRSESLEVTEADIVESLLELRPQFDLMMGLQEVDAPTLDSVMSEHIGSNVEKVLKNDEAVEQFANMVAKKILNRR